MNLRSVDLNLLVSLDAILSERSVSKAAEKLSVTQSALSHALGRLRTMFDDPLFRRGSRGLEPTDRAMALQKPLKSALAEVQGLLNAKVAFDPTSTERQFQLSMSDAMSVESLPRVMRQLRLQGPNIDLLVRTSGPRDACAGLISGEIELAIGVYPQVPQHLLRQELYRDKLVCVADKTNPLLKRGRLNRSAYLASPHVTVAPNLDSGIQLDEILAAMGVIRKVAATVPHYLAIPELIRGTDLVGHVSSRLLSVFRASPDIAVFPIPIRVEVPELLFEQVWHKRHENDIGHKWLRNLISDAIGAAAKR